MQGTLVNPWSENIPHAAEQLSPAPQLLSLVATTTEVLAHQQQKPPQWEACALQQGIASTCHNWRQLLQGNQDPAQPNIKANMR